MEDKIKELKAEIEEKEQEIADHEMEIEIIQLNAEKRLKNKLYKIADNMCFEYNDFQNALSMPMSIELGECLRIQLQHVFESLERNGVPLKDILY